MRTLPEILPGKDEVIEQDEAFMCVAIQEARKAAQQGEVPIGAVVVFEGEIIAQAHNHRETDQDPSAHAEFSAVVQAARELERWRLPDCTVYVTLEPCIMCAGLLHQARIGRCVYGAPDQKAGALGTLYSVHSDPRLNHSFEVEPGILRKECLALLQDFFAQRRGAPGQGAGAVAPCACHDGEAHDPDGRAAAIEVASVSASLAALSAPGVEADLSAAQGISQTKSSK